MLKRTSMHHDDDAVEATTTTPKWDRVSVLRCIGMHLDVTAAPQASLDHHLGRAVAAVAKELRAGVAPASSPRKLPFWLLAVFVDGAITSEEEACVLEAIMVDNSILAEIVAAFKAKHEIRTGLTIPLELSEHLKALPWLATTTPDDWSAEEIHSQNDSALKPIAEQTVEPTAQGSSLPEIDAGPASGSEPEFAISAGLKVPSEANSTDDNETSPNSPSHYAKMDDEVVDPSVSISLGLFGNSVSMVQLSTADAEVAEPVPSEELAVARAIHTSDDDHGINNKVSYADAPGELSNVALLTHLYQSARTEVEIPELHIPPTEDKRVSRWWKLVPLLAVLGLIAGAGSLYFSWYPDERIVRAVSRLWVGARQPSEKERIDKMIKDYEKSKADSDNK